LAALNRGLSSEDDDKSISCTFEDDEKEKAKFGQVKKGEKVTVLSPERGESFHLSPSDKHLLLESIAQANRGEFVDVDELLAELDELN